MDSLKEKKKKSLRLSVIITGASQGGSLELINSLILQNTQACPLCWECESQEHAERQKAVAIVGLYLVSHVMGASAAQIWHCKFHACVEAGLCCCCTVALLGLAFALDGCKSREPFFTVEGRPLVLGLKDSVCIVL